MRLFASCRRLATDNRGNTAIMFALAMPVFVGVVGLGVETGIWYYKQRTLQTAADVAAIAGAVEKRAGKTLTVIRASATAEAAEGDWSSATGTIVVNNGPTSGNYTGNANAVEVQLTMPVARYFSAIFSTSTVTETARAVALTSTGGDACILGLDPSASGAVTFTGNNLTFLNGCNVMSNSLSSSAMIINGSADVTAPCAMASGGVTFDDGLTLTQCTEPQTHVPPAADPYAGVAEPAVSGPCLTLPNGNGAETLTPGRYCGGGNLKGNKTFAPGVYVFDGGDFRINAGANVAGSGVTMYMANNATTDFNGTANISLSAPTSGTYKGLLFFGSRNNSYNSNKFNGNASSNLTGALYFPAQDVQFLGNFSGNNGCLRVIGRTVKFTGSLNINANCAAAGLDAIPLPGRVTLVE